MTEDKINIEIQKLKRQVKLLHKIKKQKKVISKYEERVKNLQLRIFEKTSETTSLLKEKETLENENNVLKAQNKIVKNYLEGKTRYSKAKVKEIIEELEIKKEVTKITTSCNYMSTRC